MAGHPDRGHSGHHGRGGRLGPGHHHRQNWSIIKSIFDGLMDYEPGTTKLVPHLAESFTVSADGKSYTFKLRRGVKFHNGREVTAADVKYSLERTLNPKTQSPGAGFFGDIAGTKEFADGKAKE